MNQFNARRNFIKISSLVAGGIGMGLQNSLFAQHLQQRKIGYALVGLGYYSRILADALQETNVAKLAALVTGTPEKEKTWGEKYNILPENIYNYRNFDSILQNDQVDVVYVVLPNHMHKEFVIRSARAGKHVLCEKPMAMNAFECEEMIAECEKRGVKLEIGYRLHYDPTTQYIMQMAKEKPFGNIRYISASAGWHASDTYSNWRTKKQYGGGVSMDMGVYSLQAAMYTTGMEPLSVSAQKFNRREIFKEVDEASTFQLEFPEGIVANLHSSFYSSVNLLSVSAANGWFKIEPFQAYSGIKGTSSMGDINFPILNQQAAQMDAFANDILYNIPNKVPGEEGLLDMRIVDAIYKSMENGGRKIVFHHA